VPPGERLVVKLRSCGGPETVDKLLLNYANAKESDGGGDLKSA